MKRLFSALLMLFAVTATAHADTFGVHSPLDEASLEVAVEHYEGVTLHTDSGRADFAAAVHAQATGISSSQALAVLGAGVVLYTVLSGDAETAGWALATTAPALPESIKAQFEELKKNFKRIGELEEQIKGISDGQSEVKQEIQNISVANAEKIDEIKAATEKAMNDRQDEFEAEAKKRFGNGAFGNRKSAGAQFVESDNFKSAPDKKAIGGTVVELHRSRKDVTMSSNTNPPNYTGEVVMPQSPRLTMREILPVGRSARDVIEYVRLTQRADNAAIVAEGALKPESNLATEDVSAQMQVIAHHIPVTKQQLSDHDGLRSLIDSELEKGIERKEDAFVLNDPTQGLIPNATVYDEATYGDVVIDGANDDAGTQLILHIRGGIAQLEVADYAPTDLVLNPLEWFKMETARTKDGAFRFVNPQNRAGARLWGLRVASTNQIAATDFLLGDLASAAMLFDGQLEGTYGIQLSTGYVNDQFIRNQLTILCEQRMLVTIKRPGAMVYYDSDAV